MAFRQLTFTSIGFLILSICCIQCVPDSNQNQFTPKTPAEVSFLEDYESPLLKWGFIDVNNVMLIPAKYDDLRDFTAGLAAANYQGQWGFINKLNEVQIPFQYRSIIPFKSEIAFGQDFELKWHCINAKGEVLFSEDYQEIGNHNGNLIVVKKDNYFGIIDKNGSSKLPITYEGIKIFDNCIAVKQNGKWKLLDLNLAPVSQTEYDAVYAPSSDRIRYRKNGKYGFLNLNAKAINNNQYDKAYDYSQGTSIVRIDGKYKLIDPNGTTIKALDFARLDYAGQGFWKYKEASKWGLLNKQGEKLTEANFDLLNRFQENRMVYSQDEKWGYLDRSGKAITPAYTPLAWDFKNGYARMIGRTGIGFIDTTCQVVIKPQYYEVRDFVEGLARVQVF